MKRKYSNKERLEIRRQEAAERAAEYGAMSVQQKIARLDLALGANIGAAKQRAALALAVKAPTKPLMEKETKSHVKRAQDESPRKALKK